MSKSLFIIVIGPPGSGKGYLMNTLVKILLLHNKHVLRDDHNYKHARIDDYVEKDADYNIESLKIIKEKVLQNEELLKYLEELNKNDCSSINYSELNNSFVELDKVAVELSNLYFKIREKYNNVCDNDLNVWLSERQNIVFETTGQYKFDWLFENTELSDVNVLNDYTVVMIYPFVTKDIVLTRVIKRFLTGLNNVVNNSELNNSSLRLPILVTGDHCLLKMIETIQNNIAEYISLCSSHCSRNKINTILFYDNMLKTPILSINLECSDSICFSDNCRGLYKFWNNYHNVLSKNLVDSVINLSKFCSIKN